MRTLTNTYYVASLALVVDVSAPGRRESVRLNLANVTRFLPLLGAALALLDLLDALLALLGALLTVLRPAPPPLLVLLGVLLTALLWGLLTPVPPHKTRGWGGRP